MAHVTAAQKAICISLYHFSGWPNIEHDGYPLTVLLICAVEHRSTTLSFIITVIMAPLPRLLLCFSQCWLSAPCLFCPQWDVCCCCVFCIILNLLWPPNMPVSVVHWCPRLHLFSLVLTASMFILLICCLLLCCSIIPVCSTPPSALNQNMKKHAEHSSY